MKLPAHSCHDFLSPKLVSFLSISREYILFTPCVLVYWITVKLTTVRSTSNFTRFENKHLKSIQLNVPFKVMPTPSVSVKPSVAACIGIHCDAWELEEGWSIPKHHNVCQYNADISAAAQCRQTPRQCFTSQYEFNCLPFCFYHPQRSWGKVMFLQASVILLTGGYLTPPGADPPRAHTPPHSRPPPRTRPPPEQTPPEQTTPPQSRTCFPPPPQRACCEIRSTRGRYASYWNAILFKLRITDPVKNGYLVSIATMRIIYLVLIDTIFTTVVALTGDAVWCRRLGSFSGVIWHLYTRKISLSKEGCSLEKDLTSHFLTVYDC